MDHELMTMWLSVDPMADKYPSLSPYNYCAWNPVKLVDPDGREIWIKGSDGNEYQYKEGKLYNKDGSAYEGNDEFATRVQKDLNTLKEKGMGEQVESLDKSKNKHTIQYRRGKNQTDPGKEGNDKISNGVGCGTTIDYDPEMTKYDGWSRPAVVGLAHETQHAYEMDKGKYDKTKVLCVKWKFCNPLTSGPGTRKITIGDVTLSLCESDTKEIERGEYSAIQAANRVYTALGGKSPRRFTTGYAVSQLK